MEHPVVGVMITMTTYGVWLRGDQRGWSEDGRVLSPNPCLQARDRKLMLHEPFFFTAEQWHSIGEFIGRSLIDRLRQRLLAITIQSWHVHFVVTDSDSPVPDVVRCAKQAVRYGLRPGRPIWGDGYDKRFCFDERSLRQRIAYVEKHNLESGLPERPWSFIESLDE